MSKKAAPTTWLWISGGVLILVTVLLLVSLNRSDEPQPGTDRLEASGRTPRPVRRRAVLTPPERKHVTRRTPAAADATAPSTAAAPDASSTAASPTPGVRPVPTPGTHTAPAAIPAKIQQETDPVRKARLMRMHRLAIARVRASQLRRRSQLLTRSLALAKKNNSWSAEKIREAEKDLVDLSRAIEIAEKNVEVTKQRLEQGDR